MVFQALRLDQYRVLEPMGPGERVTDHLLTINFVMSLQAQLIQKSERMGVLSAAPPSRAK